MQGIELFNSLIDEVSQLNEDEYYDFFKDYFTLETYDNLNLELEDDESLKRANEILFLGDEELLTRIEDALDIYDLHPFALFAYIHIAMDADIQKALERVMSYSDSVDNLKAWQRDFFYLFLDMYCDFMMEMRNLTKALKIQKIIEKNYKNDITFCVRYGLIYSILEKAEEFYAYYCENDFNDPLLYVLLLSVLLKHEDYYKAKDVYSELRLNYPFFNNLDRPWEVEGNESEEANQFFAVLEACAPDLRGVPNFFNWCLENKEEVYHC